MGRDTSFFTTIKQEVPLEDYLANHLGVELVPSGPARQAAVCPFHEEDTPSFFVMESDEGPWKRWWCFGACQEGGTVIDAVMKAEGFEEANDAADYLNDLYQLGLEVNSEAYQRFRRTVAETKADIERTREEFSKDSRQARAARNYLIKRGLSDETIDQFQLGVDTSITQSGRISIPLIDKANHPVSVASRAIFDGGYPCASCKEIVLPKDVVKRRHQARKAEEKGLDKVDWKACPHCGAPEKEAKVAWLVGQDPKYRFLREFDKANLLYNQHEARRALVKDQDVAGLFLVEGQGDVWAGWQSGHKAICAYFGAELSDWQAREAVDLAGQAGKPVILVPDFDETGQANIDKNIRKLRAVREDIEIQVLHGVDELEYKPGQGCKDLGDVLKHFGHEKVAEVLEDNRWAAPEWQVRQIIDATNQRTGEPFYSKTRQMELIAEILHNIKTKEALDHLVPYLAKNWRIREDLAQNWFHSNLNPDNVVAVQHLVKDIIQAREEAQEFLSETNVIPLGFEELDACFPGDGARKGQLMMILGKAQPLDAKVLTPEGWKEMGQIEVGDKVINPEGGVARVRAVHPQGVRPIYRVVFSDGAVTECDEEHLWKIASPGHNSWDVKTLREIGLDLEDRAWSHKRVYIPLSSPVGFDSSDELPIDPYLLGVLLGDGSLTKGTPRFTSADKEMVTLVGQRLPEDIEVRAVGAYEYNLSRIEQFGGSRDEITGRFNTEPNPLTQLLKDLDLFGKRADDKHVPDQYLNSSIEDRLALLRGLMDTDGTIHRQSFDRQDGSIGSSGSCEFTSCSLDLAESVQYLVRSLGGTASIKIGSSFYVDEDGEKQQCRNRYRVRVSMPENMNPFLMSRKADLWSFNKSPRRYIQRVEAIGSKEAQCIELDSDNQLYLTDDFIVTHNSGTGKTMLASQMLAHMADAGIRSIFFSLEQRAGSFYSRLACQVLDLPSPEVDEMIRNGDPALRKVDEVYKNMYLVDNVPTQNNDAVDMTPGRIQSIIQEVNMTHFEEESADVVIVDHLGILEVGPEAPRDVRGSDVLAPGYIMQELFKVCKAVDVFLIILQQLPKEVPPGMPYSYDAGRGGSKQTDYCDYILQIYRPEQKADIDEQERLEVEGQYKIIFGKNRYGASTLAHLYFDKSTLRIMPPLQVPQPHGENPDGPVIEIEAEEEEPLMIGAPEQGSPSGEVGATQQGVETLVAEKSDPVPEDTKELLAQLGAEAEEDGPEQLGDPKLLDWFER